MFLPAGEFAGPELLDQLPVLLDSYVGAQAPAGLLAPGPLLGHGGVEAGHVDLGPPLGGHLLGDLEREAEGVVELERHRPGQRGATGGGQFLVEHRRAGPQRRAKALLFAADHPHHEVTVGHQLRIGAAHDGHCRVDQLRGDHLVDPEEEGVADRPADDAAQHVAPVLVGGEDPVAHQEGHGAGVFGEDAQRHVGTCPGAERRRRRLLGRRHQRRQHVGLVHRVDALQDGQDALQTGSGVDAGLG